MPSRVRGFIEIADERAWALVGLAGDLARAGCYDEALQALDLAWHLSPGEAASSQLFACAIAIHCDCGEYELALKLERLFAERGIDLRLALAFQRLHAELFADGRGRAAPRAARLLPRVRRAARRRRRLTFALTQGGASVRLNVPVTVLFGHGLRGHAPNRHC